MSRASEEDVADDVERGLSLGDLAQRARVRACRARRDAENKRAMAVAIAWEEGDDDAFDVPAPET